LRHEKALRALSRGGNLARQVRRARQRFLAKHVFASPQHRQAQLVMGSRRCADIDQVQLRIVDQLGGISGRLHASHVQPDRLFAPYVARDFGKVPVQVPTARIANRRHSRAVDRAISPDVRCGHETKADDANVNHRQLLRLAALLAPDGFKETVAATNVLQALLSRFAFNRQPAVKVAFF